MNVMQKMIDFFLRPYTRRRAQGMTIEQVIADLEATRDEIMPRIDRAQDSDANREAINHFIGIERWAANRIRVAMGQAEFELDSNRRYRLPDAAPLAELQSAFRTAREETLELAREVQRSGMDTSAKVEHNDLGPLTVIEWFVYIRDHSAREIVRVREKQVQGWRRTSSACQCRQRLCQEHSLQVWDHVARVLKKLNSGELARSARSFTRSSESTQAAGLPRAAQAGTA